MKNFKIVRIFGIDIQLNWTLIFLFGYLLWIFVWKFLPQNVPDQPRSAYLLYGALTVFAFLFSIIFHEMAHSLVMKVFNVPVKSITLFFFGGVAQMEQMPKAAKAEFWISLAGPLSSMALFILFAILAAAMSSQKLASESLFALSSINLALAVSNIIPIFPMDGGRILRAVCWWKTGNILKATIIALYAAIALGFIAPLAVSFYWGMFNAIWLAFLIWFLIIPMGNAEYKALKNK